MDATHGSEPSADAGAPIPNRDVLEAFLDQSSEGVLVTDDEGRIAMINAPAEQLFGYERRELVGQPVETLLPAGLPSRALESQGAPADRRWREAELNALGRHKDGSDLSVHVSVTYPADPGRFAATVFLRAAVRDEALRAPAGGGEAVLGDGQPSAPAAAAPMGSAPLHDRLTGLPSEVLFMDRLSVSLAGSARKSSMVAVLLLDIDRFRLVNDSYGTEIGDRILVGVAERLFGILRPGDSLARVGEDEFAILCDDIAKTEGAATIAERAHAAVAAPFAFDGESVSITSSLGYAVGSGQLNSPESLTRRAQEALDRAKDRGPGFVQSFDQPRAAEAAPTESASPAPPETLDEPEKPPEAQPVGAMAAAEPLSQAAAESEPLPGPGPAPAPAAIAATDGESPLLGALQRGEFRLAYQPIIHLQTGGIAGVEALLRWQDPARGLVSPGDFMAEAEETGLIQHIGAWVLREVCRDAERLQAASPDGAPLMLSVNLSARQLEAPDFVDLVRGILAGSRVDPGTFYLEIGESSVMDDTDATSAVLGELRAVGVRMSIDDFGTGFSSLLHLNRFPIDFLKVDRSFVEGLDRDPGAANIVTAVISMAHALGMPTIAEGVETAEQLYTLRRLGCDYAQGYLFARPQVLADVLELLATNPTW
ncbi:MAG: EAL domain-containing protein [Actinomycetota bacterium]